MGYQRRVHGESNQVARSENKRVVPKSTFHRQLIVTVGHHVYLEKGRSHTL